MSRRSDTEEFFHYTRLQREVQQMIAELASQSRNNPSYQHIWQVYQKVIEFERNERETVHSLYDTLPQMHPELHTPDGQSQNLLNDRDAILVCQKASNVYESIHRMLRQIRQLAVRAATDSTTDADRASLRNQIKSLFNEITRQAEGTVYNGEKYLADANAPQNMQVQVGPWNIAHSDFGLAFNNVTMSGLATQLSLSGSYFQQPSATHNNGLDENASPPQKLGNSEAQLLISDVDRMMKFVTKCEADNGNQINRLRSAQDKSREDIYSIAKSMESSLRQVADYYRQMAQYYYAVCPKKDIPSGCN